MNGWTEPAKTIYPFGILHIPGNKYGKYHKMSSVIVFVIGNSNNPFLPSGLFYLHSLDTSFSYIRGVWLVLINIISCSNFLTLCKQYRL